MAGYDKKDVAMPAVELTEKQLKAIHEIKAFTEKRMAAFDAGDVPGTMEGWAKEGSEFIVTYPKVAGGKDDVKMEGFEAINGLETTFAGIIKENFGKSWHEMVTWKWPSVSEEEVEVSIYCRLWLTDKESGKFKQMDLTGKTGRFEMVCKHKKIDGEWKIVSQVAISEDED